MKRVEAAKHRYEVDVERGFSFITDTANWSRYWPGYVQLDESSSWGAVGDTARLTTRLFGRERELTMTITAFEPNRLVTYTSRQAGLPDAFHERHFEPDGEVFVYRLVVEYEPRSGIVGLFDRLLLARGISRAFQSTFVALGRGSSRSPSDGRDTARADRRCHDREAKMLELRATLLQEHVWRSANGSRLT